MPPRTKQPLAEQPDDARRPARARAARPAPKTSVDVVAVLVAHDGAAWLPEALAALAASTHKPRSVICVDTGSTDGSVALMAEAYGEVLELARTTGYGEAVAHGLAHAPGSTWVWLLHDDVAVDPTTLGALLDHAESSPSAALLGPKVQDWHDRRYLVEVGLTSDLAGHRETGLERREYDQGQHDAVRDVLAVGTAAALVRRDAWEAVGGLDPQLPVFRDDLDLGWKLNAAGHRVVVVPRAVVRHVRAATTGHRETDAAPGRASGVDRKNALWVLLAHATWLRLVTLVPRLVLATMLRSVVLLLTRQPGAAGDEWRALLGVLGHPGVLHRGRLARRTQRTVRPQDLKPLFASRALRMRARTAAFGDWLSGGAPVSSTLGALGDPGPEGPDLMDFSTGSGLIRSLFLRPGVLLFFALGLVATVAERSVLAIHGGTLHGGALLGPPAGAGDLWSTYVAAWHDVSVGTGAPTPPASAMLALLSGVLFGKPWLAVDTLLLASVPLAGVTAYLAASRLVRHLYLRVWAAATWALLPVATGAVAAGRLDAAVVQIALPLLALATAHVLTGDPGTRGWWRVWGLGLGLSATCAFAPLLWPLAALVLLVGAAVNLRLQGARSRALAALLVAVVPLIVLFPWSLSALGRPSGFLVGQQPADLALPAWRLVLLSPGGPGVPFGLLTAGLVLAGLGGTIREAFRRLALVCWGVALVGLAAAGFLARVQVEGKPVWPGLALQLSGLAVVVAALVAANGVRHRLAQYGFGWRQPLAAVIAGTAALLPVVAAGAWIVRGAEDPLRRDHKTLLPAFAAAELESGTGLRALALQVRPDGRIAYALLNGGAAPGLTEAGLRPGAGQRRQLDALVADLTSPRGSDAAEALSTRGVRYVVLGPGPHRSDLVNALDAQAGLVRRTAGETELWQVVAPSNRLMVLGPDLAKAAVRGDRAPSLEVLRRIPPDPLLAGRESAHAVVPQGDAGRLLVLAEAHDGGWHASIDGTRLTAKTAWGWGQAFELPAAGGHLTLSYSRTGRDVGLLVQLVLVTAVAVLAAPAGRKRRGLEEDVEDVEDVEDRSVVTI